MKAKANGPIAPTTNPAPGSTETETTSASGAVVTITTEEVQALVADCTAFAEVLGASAKLLSKTEMQHLAKPRKNASQFVKIAAAVAGRYNVASPSYPVATLLANQQLADDLIPAIEAVQTLLKLLQNSSLSAASSAWTGASVLYGMLKVEAPSNPAIASAIQPLRVLLRPALLTPEGTKTVKRSRSASAINKKAKVANGAPASSSADSPPNAPVTQTATQPPATPTH